MSDINPTLIQIEDMFHSITARIYGYDIDNSNPNIAKAAKAAADVAIRIAWPTSGSPAWKVTDDRTFLQVTFEEDDYTKQREFTYSRKTDLLANQAMEMTNVLRIAWVIYGPNSYQNAFKLYTQLPDPKITLYTTQQKVFLIPDLASPRRAPEQFSGQWWERVDFSARYNAKVLINTDTPYLLSADIDIKSEDSLVSANINIVSDVVGGG